MFDSFSIDFPRAYDDLLISGRFRSYPDDFIVNEVLGFAPTGDGEHVLLHIEKTGQNTHWVADEIAKQCHLDKKAVGYCGRKDRHAVTRQWLSLYDPKRTVNSNGIDVEGVTILQMTRHIRKLRPGDHAENQFVIRLRDCYQRNQQSPFTKQEKTALEQEVSARLHQGVPNYFGSQRFGRECSNLFAAQAWLVDKKSPPRQRKSMVMSAARAYLFNQVVAERVKQNNWQFSLEGDHLIDNLPTAPLWGRGRLTTSLTALALETEALDKYALWCHGLEHCGLQQERRLMKLCPTNVDVNWIEDDIELKFSLPSGAFATAVLAEIATLRESE